MSNRLVAAIGLVCLVMAVAVMYLPFVDVYASAAAKADAEATGEPAPVAVSSFVWPTDLPPARGRTVLLSLVLAAVTSGCLLTLARRRPLPAQG